MCVCKKCAVTSLQYKCLECFVVSPCAKTHVINLILQPQGGDKLYINKLISSIWPGVFPKWKYMQYRQCSKPVAHFPSTNAAAKSEWIIILPALKSKRSLVWQAIYLIHRVSYIIILYSIHRLWNHIPRHIGANAAINVVIKISMSRPNVRAFSCRSDRLYYA